MSLRFQRDVTRFGILIKYDSNGIIPTAQHSAMSKLLTSGSLYNDVFSASLTARPAERALRDRVATTSTDSPLYVPDIGLLRLA